MTIQIDQDGPSIEDWRSSKFTATVNGNAIYVYGYERAAQFKCAVWDASDDVEQHWISYGADETTTVVITDTAGDITSAIVYPLDAGVTQSIDDGVLTLTVPPNVRVRVELSEDRAGVISLRSTPLVETPTDYTDYTTLPKIVESIDDSEITVWTSSTAHGLATGQRVLIKSTATRPSTASGVLDEFVPLYAFVISETKFELGTTVSESDISITSGGSGTITVTPAEWSTGTLLIPEGEHRIGWSFEVGSDATIFIERGAVAIGSFHLKEPNTLPYASSSGVTIDGAGVLAGNYIDPLTVYGLGSFDLKRVYSAVYAYEVTGETDNTISGITMVAHPYYANSLGVREYVQVQIISPWNYSTDGFDISSTLADGLLGSVRQCYALVGDDAIKIRQHRRSMEYVDTFVTVSNNGCIQHYSLPLNGSNTGLTASLTNIDVMNLGEADLELSGGAGTVGSKVIWKALTDGTTSQSDLGHFDVTIDGLNVWGPVECRLMLLGNITDPFGTGQDLRGQVANFVLSNITCQQVPAQKSRIVGFDATNTPHDIAFTGLTIGYVAVTANNFSDYFEVDPLVYNLSVDGVLMESLGFGNHFAAWLHQDGKTNPYPPGFNYPNHYARPSVYQPFEGPGLLGHPRIGVAPGIALQLSEHLGETIYVAQCAIEDSGVGIKTVYPDDDATTPFAWLDVKSQQSWSPNSGGAYARMQAVIDSTVTAMAAENNTGSCEAIFWVGGEEDASYENMADNYYVSCGTLKREMRKAIKAAGLYDGPAASIPFVHAKVKESFTYAETVNAAILRLSVEDPYMACYDVEDLTLMDDGVGYDGAGQSLSSERAYAAYLRLLRPSTSRVEICNMALSNIGDGATVTSIDPPDGSLQARICAQFFDIAVNKAMEAHAWDFAVKRVSPTAVTTDRSEWLFSYTLPDDYMGVLTVLPEGATDDDHIRGMSIRVPYTIAVDAYGAKRLFANSENVILLYKSRVWDSAQWSESFVIYLSWVLASMIAPPQIKGDKGIEASKMALQMAKFHLSEAQTYDVQTSREKPQADDLAEWDRLSR